MGEKTITTQIKIDGEIVPDFSFDWEVEFQGEKYIMPLRMPAGSKDNEKLKSQIDLTFQHWAIYQLKRWPFVTIQQIAAGTYLPDEEVATVSLNLGDFCELFGQVLEYYYGGKITLDFNDYKKNPTTGWVYDDTATVVTISHTKIWNVLIDSFHDKYGVRWEIKAASDNSNTVKGGERYVIRVGYPTTEVDHIFEYGFEGGLLKVERQVQSEEIRNMLKGRGGDKNIPFRYFKNTDPNNKDFKPDPDWVEELKNIYFSNLMPATFRSYVQGWKAAHISKYPGYTAVGESNAYAPWAYRKGYTDTKFSPVEFVADEITINPATGDKQVEILPGYSPYVKKGSSLDKYGPLPDTLDNNDDIYPTLQGTGMDIAVDVEQVTDDDSQESPIDVTIAKLSDLVVQITLNGHERKTVTSQRAFFNVPTGRTANLIVDPVSAEGDGRVQVEDYRLNVYNKKGEKLSASGMAAGSYSYELEMDVYNTDTASRSAVIGTRNARLQDAVLADTASGTFKIWVRNIWGSDRQNNETDSQYSERVWRPVLGDREGNTAKVMFTSGALATSEDYEFTIVGFPAPDTSKTWTDENGVTYTSHWRITLAKSDAELEATGLYVPSTQKQGKAGDTFVLIGTEMTHIPYVVDAEIRLANWDKDQLDEKKEIKPTAVVTTDRVRLNNEGQPDALINQLRVGNSLRLFDKRFFNEEGKTYETLYLQSITYTYREPTSDDAALNPDVEIVLGNEYTTSANPVSIMQGEISALQRQVGSISNISQIVTATGDKRYARKESGITERIGAVWQMLRFMMSVGYNADALGTGWQLGLDDDGLSSLTVDRLYVRYKAIFDSLEIRRLSQVGGVLVLSPAGGTIISVEEAQVYLNTLTLKDADGKALKDADGKTLTVCDESSLTSVWRCRLRTTDGERQITNDFAVGDLVQCRTFNLATGQRFYWRRCLGVGADYIDLSKTDCAKGSDTPMAGDEIATFGNDLDTGRQNAISIAAYGDGSPSITLYRGIKTYSTGGCDKTRISADGSKFTGDFVVQVEGREVPLAQFLSDRISLSVTGQQQRLVTDDQTATDIDVDGSDEYGTRFDFRSAEFATLPAGTRIALEIDTTSQELDLVFVELRDEWGFTLLAEQVYPLPTMRFETTLEKSPGQYAFDNGEDPARTLFNLYISLPPEQVTGWRIYTLPLAGGLKNTGIDIERGKITLKGDTEIITNDGKSAALFRNGKIKAEYVEAENVSATRLETIPESATAKARTVIEHGKQIYYDDNGEPRLLVHSGQIADGNSGRDEFAVIATVDEVIPAFIRAAEVTLFTYTPTALSEIDLSAPTLIISGTLAVGDTPLPDYGNGPYYGNVEVVIYDGERTIAQRTVAITAPGALTLSLSDFGKAVLDSGTSHVISAEVRVNSAMVFSSSWRLQVPMVVLPVGHFDTATEIAANGAVLRSGDNYARVLPEETTLRCGQYMLRVCHEGIQVSHNAGSSWDFLWS